MEEYITPDMLKDKIESLRMKSIENVDTILSVIPQGPSTQFEWQAFLSSYKDYLEMLALTNLYIDKFGKDEDVLRFKSDLEGFLTRDEEIILGSLTR